MATGDGQCSCDAVAAANEALRSFARGRSGWDRADLAELERLRQRWISAASRPSTPACGCGVREGLTPP
ncbi:hypothetical protein [Streptomyces abyssalis]|uniref:hypothetical protein n=1 Tax=Streptomyces abyssalis TaxID=933944 RepID=UPI000D1BBFEB|nr:hypothetical protein [Streptomyces abyssalis]